MRPRFLPLFFMPFMVSAQCWMKAPLTDDVRMYDPATFVIGDKAFFPCGWFTGTESINKQATYVYMSTLDQWGRVANFPAEGRCTAKGFTIGNMGYVTFGSWSNIGWYNDLWQYDPVHDTWTQKADVPAPGRDFPISFSLNGYGYVGTGRHDHWTHVGTDFWRYEAANDIWTKLPDVPGPGRILAVAMPINGKAYIGLGMTSKSPSSNLNDFYEYDPLTNNWKKLNPPPISGGSYGTFTIKGKGYLHRNLDGFWEYDPSTDSWQQLPDCVPHIASGMSGFSIYDKGYLAFGSIGNWQLPNQLFQYSPPSLNSLNEHNPSSLNIFPNPVTSHLQFEKEFSNDTKALIYDVNGKIVMAGQVINNRLQVENLLAGLYLVRIDAHGEHYQTRFLKN